MGHERFAPCSPLVRSPDSESGCPVSTSPLPSLRVLRGRQTHSRSLCFVFLKQDLDQVQLHLEEARFFDVFGFSEAAGAWQCFMCNNPERATGESRPPAPGRSESHVPLGLPGTQEPHHSGWLSSCIHTLSWNNA